MNSMCWQNTFEVRYDLLVSKTMSILIKQDNNVHFLEETKGDGLAGLRPASCGLLWDWWLTGNKLKLPNQTKPNSRNQTN